MAELEDGVEGRAEGEPKDDDKEHESLARPSFSCPLVSSLTPRSSVWAFQVVFPALGNFFGWTLKSNTSKMQPNSPGCDEDGGHTTLNP